MREIEAELDEVEEYQELIKNKEYLLGRIESAALFQGEIDERDDRQGDHDHVKNEQDTAERKDRLVCVSKIVLAEDRRFYDADERIILKIVGARRNSV